MTFSVEVAWAARFAAAAELVARLSRVGVGVDDGGGVPAGLEARSGSPERSAAGLEPCQLAMAEMMTPAMTVPAIAVTDSPIRLRGVGGVGPCDDELLGDARAAWTGAAAMSVAVEGDAETNSSALSVG